MKKCNIENELSFKIYVSPGCENRGDGTKNSPYSSIKEAQKAMRAEIAKGLDGDAAILFTGGTYYLDETVKIGFADCDKNHKIYYSSADGEDVTLIGGVPVTGWKECKDGVFYADISQIGDFYTLFCNGKRQRTARSGDMSGEGIKDSSHLQAVCENSSAWFGEILKVKSISENGIETFIRKCDWSGNFTYLCGAREFIKDAGDWAIEENRVYFKPEDPKKIGESVIVAGTLNEIFTVRGENEKPVNNIEICGFSLMMNAFGENLAAQSRPANILAEYDENINALVSLQNAKNVTVKNCRMTYAGYVAVTLKGCCENDLIYANDIESPGYAGIFLIGENPGSLNYISKHNTVCGNRIRSAGEFVCHGAGIYLINSGENLITHNEIDGVPRYGISMKGMRYGVFHDNGIDGVPFEEHWKYNQTTKNVISYNKISNTGKRSADGGGIEGWGIGRDNVIDHNIICGAYRGKATENWRGHSIFLDDAAHHVTVTNNIIYDESAPAVNAGIFIKSIGNIVINNIFDVSFERNGAADIQPYICPAGDSVFERNIVYANGDGVIERDGSKKDGNGDRIMLSFGDGANSSGTPSLKSLKSMNRNLYFNKNGRALIDIESRMMTFDEWQNAEENIRGYDKNSICTDPIFVCAEKRDYRLCENSPALALGFEPIDTSEIGLTKDFLFE